MKTAKIQTRCECQAKLSAIVDEECLVLAGSVKAPDGSVQTAVATAVGAGKEQFQVGWQCPRCGRNVVRSIYRGALTFLETASDDSQAS